jgi:hypothetical protein
MPQGGFGVVETRYADNEDGRDGLSQGENRARGRMQHIAVREPEGDDRGSFVVPLIEAEAEFRSGPPEPRVVGGIDAELPASDARHHRGTHSCALGAIPR